MPDQSENRKISQRLILWSPFLVIGAGHLTAQLAGLWIGAWAWLPLTIVFWTIMALLIAGRGGWKGFRQRLSVPQGSRWWFLLAVLVGFIPFIVFWQNRQLLDPYWLRTLWVLFALINPWLEEGYWRGLLLDAAEDWAGWKAVLYTSTVYAASHPLMWGVNSYANREWIVFASTFVMGVCWAIIYRRTKSLRYPVFSHILVDLFNLSVAIFLNLNIVHTN